MINPHGTEVHFKNWFRSHWDGWLESYEPRGGTGMGIPDVQVLIGDKLFPIELKIGRETATGLLKPHNVRPAQIEWHRRFCEAGGRSAMLVGVPVDTDVKYRVRIVPGMNLAFWVNGYDWTSALELRYPANAALREWFHW